MNPRLKSTQARNRKLGANKPGRPGPPIGAPLQNPSSVWSVAQPLGFSGAIPLFTKPVQFELMTEARKALLTWLERRGGAVSLNVGYPSSKYCAWRALIDSRDKIGRAWGLQATRVVVHQAKADIDGEDWKYPTSLKFNYGSHLR